MCVCGGGGESSPINLLTLSLSLSLFSPTLPQVINKIAPAQSLPV